LFHADGETGVTKLIVAFRNFVNAPKTCQYIITGLRMAELYATETDNEFWGCIQRSVWHQHRVEWHYFVNTAVELCFPYKVAIF
jgi:hypothetical protein